MRRRIVASTAVAGVAMLALAVAEARGQETVQPAANQPVHCSVFADGPRRDRDPARAIVARVRFRCDWPGADVLRLGVRLERDQGSGWRTVQAQTYTMRAAATHARVFRYLERQVTVRCTSGRFRTTVEWTRTSRGVTSSGRNRSGDIVDPCAVRDAT